MSLRGCLSHFGNVLFATLDFIFFCLDRLVFLFVGLPISAAAREQKNTFLHLEKVFWVESERCVASS